MLDLVDFENTYRQDFNQQSAGEDDALASITIDGYSVNEGKEGGVIAVVWLTKHGDVVVDWHDNSYRMNVDVLDLIKQSREQLQQEYAESKVTADGSIKVQAIWEFEASVEGINPESVNLKDLVINSAQEKLASLLEKKELSIEELHC